MSGGALRAQFFTFGGALRAQFVKLGGALRAQFVNLAARYARTCAHCDLNCDEGATVLLNDGHAKAGQRSVDRLAHRGAAHGAHRHVRSADRAHTQVATRQQHDGPLGARGTPRTMSPPPRPRVAATLPLAVARRDRCGPAQLYSCRACRAAPRRRRQKITRAEPMPAPVDARIQSDPR